MRPTAAAALVAMLIGVTACESAGRGARAEDSRGLGGPPAVQPAPPPMEGRIAYVAEHDGKRRARLLDLARGTSDELPCGLHDCYPAAVGAKGLALVAAEDQGELHHEALAFLPRAGKAFGAARPLGLASGKVRNPSWLPDGSALVVEADRDGFRDLYLVRAEEGAAPERLTDHPLGSFEPAVSPSGQAIAFVSSRDGDAEIYRMSARATALGDRALQRLTWSRGDDSMPIWSPDEKRLAYVSSRRGVAALYLMDGDGAHPHPVAAPVAGVMAQHEAAFSPDGANLAFVERRADGARLRVVRLADGEVVLDGERGDSPVWSPDGGSIAFVSDRAGEPALWLVTKDGGPARRLTDEPGSQWLPRWVP